ncbi:dimethylarginine dimethylaminohydrolase family protein [Desulfobaculum bizertense]|uniref:Dimethylargininase n=1 Tax=Desulfobaculum bizertense DSM 18034 TaxID=1121442 RepID=A0A1T4WVA5_9BACT|nr:arginine deiminase-related protein [Desulfobaculum bizertense]SKA81189.1 dimethylargininase [Desulfobaculum bizertense DSM 18034]
MFSQAIVRTPCKDFAKGITTASELGAAEYELMLTQHAAYVQALRDRGLTVDVLDPEEAFPDAHFVEDVAVVVPEVAAITNPGAASRNAETAKITDALSKYRKLEYITAPGTLEGGDVLLVGKHFFIGLSDRTNKEGASQLGAIMEKYGYTWTAVPVPEGLHFKCSVNWVGGKTLLVTEDFAQCPELEGYELLIVDKAEDYASNVLLINDTFIMPAGFPKTRALLETLGKDIVELNMSETRKMDGALTCLSLRF